MYHVFVTGAYSRITQQAVLALAKLVPAYFHLSDRPETKDTDKLIEQLGPMGCRGEFVPLDLTNPHTLQEIERIKLLPLSGLLLCAATRLRGDLTEEQVARVNCDSQVEIANYFYAQRAASTGLSGVFINSLWGYDLGLPLLHEKYGIIATTKNRAQLELHKIAASLRFPNRLNFVVATLVDKTAAQILLERASRGVSQDIARNLPEGRLPTTQEVGEVIARVVLQSTSNDQVFFVPENIH